MKLKCEQGNLFTADNVGEGNSRALLEYKGQLGQEKGEMQLKGNQGVYLQKGKKMHKLQT